MGLHPYDGCCGDLSHVVVEEHHFDNGDDWPTDCGTSCTTHFLFVTDINNIILQFQLHSYVVRKVNGELLLNNDDHQTNVNFVRTLCH